MPKKRGDTGQYVETATLEDVMAVFDTVDGPPVVTSADVADETGLSRDSARRKLESLRERGEIAKRKTAGRVLYWPADGARDVDAEREHAPDATPDEGTPAAADEGERTADTSPASQPAHDAESDAQHTAGSQADPMDTGDPMAVVEDTLRELGLPGSGGKLEARIDAVGAMYAHLRDHGGDAVEKGDLLALVDPDDVGYASRTSFWNNCVKANKSQGRDTNALVALPGVEDWGGGEYRFTGTDESDAGVYDPATEFEE